MNDKRGQGLSTNAIILIILGVVVLVVLILGFTMGWSRIAPWLSNDNVDTIAQQCATACSTNSVYDFCTKKRELNDGTTKLKDVTCYYLSEKVPTYGIAACPSVSCENIVTFETCTDTDKKDKKTSQVFLEPTKTLNHTVCK
jgi:hypothetical protein